MPSSNSSSILQYLGGNQTRRRVGQGVTGSWIGKPDHPASHTVVTQALTPAPRRSLGRPGGIVNGEGFVVRGPNALDAEAACSAQVRLEACLPGALGGGSWRARDRHGLTSGSGLRNLYRLREPPAMVLKPSCPAHHHHSLASQSPVMPKCTSKAGPVSISHLPGRWHGVAGPQACTHGSSAAV